MASSSKPDQASKFNSPLLPEADEEVSPPSDADVGVLSLPWVVDAATAADLEAEGYVKVRFLKNQLESWGRLPVRR